MILTTDYGEVKIAGRISDVVDDWAWNVTETYPQGARLRFVRDDELGGTLMQVNNPPKLYHGDTLKLNNIRGIVWSD